MRWLRAVAPPLAVGLAMLGLWELVVRVGRIAPFILPAPSAIADQLWIDREVVFRAGLASGANALVGLLHGAALAIAAAMVASRLAVLADVAVPVAADEAGPGVRGDGPATAPASGGVSRPRSARRTDVIASK